MGSGRGARDADNIWCPVRYGNYRGWANAYFLAMNDGRRVACVLYPDAKECLAAPADFAAKPPLPPQQVAADPIVLECDLPGAGTPGVFIGFGSAWHGLIVIDNTWSIDDYTFRKSYKDITQVIKLTISRSSGRITEAEGDYSRTGTCHLVSKENRRF